MSPAELLERAAENLRATYLAIGAAAPGSFVEGDLDCTICRSATDHPVSNFALVRRVGPACAARLAEAAASSRSFKVYVLPTAQPSCGASLRRAGFEPAFRLHQMACGSAPADSEANLIEANTPDERLEVARFMAAQFFVRSRPEMRNMLIGATAGSGLGLYWIWRLGARVGAAMLSRSSGAIGIYNLCIAPSLQGKGHGREAVRKLLLEASDFHLPAVLQCDEDLAMWYGSLGFDTIAHVDVYTLDSV